MFLTVVASARMTNYEDKCMDGWLWRQVHGWLTTRKSAGATTMKARQVQGRLISKANTGITDYEGKCRDWLEDKRRLTMTTSVNYMGKGCKRLVSRCCVGWNVKLYIYQWEIHTMQFCCTFVLGGVWLVVAPIRVTWHPLPGFAFDAGCLKVNDGLNSRCCNWRTWGAGHKREACREFSLANVEDHLVQGQTLRLMDVDGGCQLDG